MSQRVGGAPRWPRSPWPRRGSSAPGAVAASSSCRAAGKRRHLIAVLTAALLVTLVPGLGFTAEARAAYVTSTPVLSSAPRKDVPFTASGYITPASTASSRARVKIILWMEAGDGEYGVMDVYWAKVGKRPGGKPGSAYSVTITIPMKGGHGVQAVQYRGGKKVSTSRTKYFTVQP